jgi:integrase
VSALGIEPRTPYAIASAFERLVKPDIGDYSVYEVRRSHVMNMLDEISDENGPIMADRTLAYFRKACNWYATRDDQFNSPIVRGMRGGSSKARNRTLSDDELRDLFAALEIVENVPACYPRYIKTLLLTATRRTEASRLHSVELNGDSWTIPADRYKTGIDHLIPLSAAVQVLVGHKPEGVKRNSWFVFSSTNGEKPFSGFSKAKRQLDEAIDYIRTRRGEEEPMQPWRLHDLRRTARTLMNAERALGHVVGGIRGVYNRHEYLEEKRRAFEDLSGLVRKITGS